MKYFIYFILLVTFNVNAKSYSYIGINLTKLTFDDNQKTIYLGDGLRHFNNCTTSDLYQCIMSNNAYFAIPYSIINNDKKYSKTFIKDDITVMYYGKTNEITILNKKYVGFSIDIINHKSDSTNTIFYTKEHGVVMLSFVGETYILTSNCGLFSPDECR